MNRPSSNRRFRTKRSKNPYLKTTKSLAQVGSVPSARVSVEHGASYCKGSFQIVFQIASGSLNESCKMEAFLEKEEKAGEKIFPPRPEVFNAFVYCPWENVKVVIIGQDPYHDDRQVRF